MKAQKLSNQMISRKFKGFLIEEFQKLFNWENLKTVQSKKLEGFSFMKAQKFFNKKFQAFRTVVLKSNFQSNLKLNKNLNFKAAFQTSFRQKLQIKAFSAVT